jgi:molecular chaperone HtpG
MIPLTEKDKSPDIDDSAVGTLIAAMKQALGSEVKDVRKSSRLTDSPVCIVTDAGGLDRTLEKLLSRQGQSGIKVSAPILEINPAHPAITALAAAVKSKGVSPELEDASRLLLDEAHVLEGETVNDPAGFARRMSALIAKAFS